MPKDIDQDVEDQVVAEGDDFDDDYDDEDQDDDFDDEDDVEDDEDNADYDEVAVLAEIEAAEKNHKDAIAEYNEVIAGIRQRQTDHIKELVKAGKKVADIAKVYPRKLVVEASAPSTPS